MRISLMILSSDFLRQNSLVMVADSLLNYSEGLAPCCVIHLRGPLSAAPIPKASLRSITSYV